MLYELNGHSIYMSTEEFLGMTDDEIQFHIAYESGYQGISPFSDSCLLDLSGQKIEDPDEDDEDNSLFNSEELGEMLSSDSFGEA